MNNIEILEFNGIKYKKIYDNERNSLEACKNSCCFHEIDETGESCCNNPKTSDFKFDGCAIGKFHWKEIKNEY